jgi:hypothetical protein
VHPYRTSSDTKRFQRSSFFCDILIEWWGDGTSRNDVSPYECFGTSGPHTMSLFWYIPCHFAPTKMFCKTYLRHLTDCNSDTLTLFFRNFSSTVCKPRKPFGIYKPNRCEGSQTWHLQIASHLTSLYLYYCTVNNKIRYISPLKSMNGKITKRPETMCPHTHILRPLVPKLIVSCDTMSLDWFIHVILHYTIC